MTLLELAERVEAAPGPDRELDLLVKAAVYGGEARLSPYNGQWCLYDGQDRSGRDKLRERPYSLPHEVWSKDAYTSSLDAAMSLVPEGVRVLINIAEDDLTVAIVDGTQGCADTPPLALAAACLRARAAIVSDQ